MFSINDNHRHQPRAGHEKAQAPQIRRRPAWRNRKQKQKVEAGDGRAGSGRQVSDVFPEIGPATRRRSRPIGALGSPATPLPSLQAYSTAGATPGDCCPIWRFLGCPFSGLLAAVYRRFSFLGKLCPRGKPSCPVVLSEQSNCAAPSEIFRPRPYRQASPVAKKKKIHSTPATHVPSIKAKNFTIPQSYSTVEALLARSQFLFSTSPSSN